MSNSQPSPFNSNCLNNRVALITGGASGIGLEIAKQLGLHGSKIAIMGRRIEFIDKALAVLKELKIDAIGFTGDVRVEEDTNRIVALTVEHFGKLDTLVNSAAGNFLSAAEHLKPKGFRTVLEIDAIGVFNMSKAAFEQLKASKQGVIINISATLHYGATWYQVHASAAKAAIDSVTRTLGLEWGLYNIRVNGIAPGPIADTPGMTKLAPGEGYESLVTEVVPLGKMGQKWDIAMSAVFLCSSAGSFITGETIVVDGGAWLWTPPLMARDMVGDAARGIEQKSRSKL